MTTTDKILFIIGFILAIVAFVNLKVQFISNRGYKLIGIVGATWFVLLLVTHIF